MVAFLICACGASAREKTVHATLAGVVAARDAFLVFDAAREETIKTGATSEATGHAALIAWRAKSDMVMRLVGDAFQAIAIAATADDDASIATMIKAATLIDQTIIDAEKKP